MGGGVRRPSVATTALFLVLLPLGINLFTNIVEVPDRWKPWVLVLVVGLSVVAIVIIVRGPGAGEPTRPTDGGLGLNEAADQLALTVGAQWRREEERRRVHDPFPLPVRWHAAPRATPRSHFVAVHDFE
jgi:hypothetical protein